jgi:hypothetical protein
MLPNTPPLPEKDVFVWRVWKENYNFYERKYNWKKYTFSLHTIHRREARRNIFANNAGCALKLHK